MIREEYKTRISTPDAPHEIGPYSQAIVANGMVYCAGQIALDPATNQLVEGEIEVQTRRVLENLDGVLRAAGSSLEHVVKTTVFLSDMNDFVEMNQVYARYFGTTPPARSTVAVASLQRNARVEIECVAVVTGPRAGRSFLKAKDVTGDHFDMEQEREF
jgi:2-iminobutanoate/2-iminopropanoate deaminase